MRPAAGTAARWAAIVTGVLTVGLLLPGARVPLYDGVGFPDQPYRYVEAPPGAKHAPKPVPAQATSAVLGAANSRELDVQSNEQGPQILLDLPPGAVIAPPTAHTLTVTATPLAPTTQPADGTIDGNIYRLAVTADAGQAPFHPDAGVALLYLRAATLKPAPPVFEYRPPGSATWAPLRTSRGGNDVFVTAFKGAGDYVLVHQRGAHASRGISVETALLVLLGSFVFLVILAAVAARRPWQDRDDSDTASDSR